MKKTIIITITLILTVSSMQAQGFLKKLGDRTMDKITQKAEDKLVDELSEKLANQAVKPINSVMDSLFAESYEQSTGEKYDPANSEKMAEALSGFLGSAEVPEKYEFSYVIEVETRDFGSKKSEKMKMFVTKEAAIFGMEQKEGDDAMLMIFDNENDAIVSYDLQEKQMMAFPMNSSFMSAFANAAIEEEMEAQNLKVEKLNKSKTILGYKAEAFRYTTDESEADAYISDEVPFSWDDSFGTMLQQFATHFYQENEEYQLDGMLLEAYTTRLDDKKKSEWKTKKIDEKKTIINNADYERSNLAMSDQ